MKILVKPSKKQIFSGSITWLLFNLLSLLLFFYFVVNPHFLILFPACCLLGSLCVFWVRWAILRKISWTITQEVVIQKTGILTLVTNHLELYRVADYQETQDFCQQLLGIKTLHLIGKDQLSNVISISGIPASSNLMNIIRERVEICRRNKNIYEVINN